ncbi:3-hydroxybutyrate dehydrogenase [Kineococcus xinjiangensis]|uniref:3-hydroxybutyrate dehydrogenase n=1 Tax=Kineococcus xinjiangensis TaxID=512762 RepID=A0A2S6IVG0_9ACTN|nr:3-hydroxybutyrate dehydrogenase [Kineococcus xinjiangensis]PPK98344.1 3-hydroxybutyrate dehydrogenase [Kineococcus xinjiangensis]
MTPPNGTSAANSPQHGLLDLSGRTALVTGAAGGIGAAVVARLASAGARVLAADRDRDGLEALTARTEGVEALVCDLADLDATDALPAEIDVLVNNAGIQHVAPLHEFPPDRFSFILRLMLESPFRLIRHVLPHMRERGWGRIVNVSSAHGLRASPFKAAYVSAKHGLEGLSKVAALEGAAHGITSNCVNPGYVRTPLVERQIDDQAAAHGIPREEVLGRVLLDSAAVKRLVEPEEVAEVVAFLCGPASASITGASFAVDGGWTAH